MEYNIAPKVIAGNFATMRIYKPVPDKHDNEKSEAIAAGADEGQGIQPGSKEIADIPRHRDCVVSHLQKY